MQQLSLPRCGFMNHRIANTIPISPFFLHIFTIASGIGFDPMKR